MMHTVSMARNLRLVGFRLLGPPPITDVWIPADGGVTALYGLNGAGKTKILTALADLIAGVPPADPLRASYAVAKITRGGEDAPYLATLFDLHRERNYLGDAQPQPVPASAPWLAAHRPHWERTIAEQLYAIAEPICARDSPAIIGNTGTQIRECLPAPMSEEDVKATVDEIVSLGLLSMTPSPEGWLFRPAILRDETRPRLRREIDDLTALDAAIQKEIAKYEADNQPYEVGHLLELFAAELGLRHGASILTTLSEIYEGLRDPGYYDDEGTILLLRQLTRSDVIPFRLGGDEPFFELRTTMPIRGALAPIIHEDGLSTSQANRRIAARLRGEWLSTSEPLVVQDSPHPDLVAMAASLSFSTQQIYDLLLFNAPEIELRLGDIDEWLVGKGARWYSRGVSRGDSFPLDGLSEAQRRWALIAIEVVEAELSWPEEVDYEGNRVEFAIESVVLTESPPFLLVDEPDAALHATAERHTVSGLVALANEHRLSVIVTTHSAEFLNHTSLKLLHVHRGARNEVVLERLAAPQRSRVKELGISVADLLLLTRGFLVVEGAHDMTVIQSLVGNELSELGILVLPMRGGRMLASVVDSYILGYLSDAPVIAALDNLEAGKIEAFWLDLVNVAEGRYPGAVDAVIKTHFTSKKRSEELFLIDYCRNAVSLGQTSRFRIFAFERPDIPEYLPVQAIVPSASSWDELRGRFEGQRKFLSFKPWLKSEVGIEITDELLISACEQLDEVPYDFVRLVDTCRLAQRRSGM